MQSTDTFYQNLPVLPRFSDVAAVKAFTRMPDDWLVIIADVKDSTLAIREGRYKEVNMLGVSAIMAVVNNASQTDLPFVFGGDGATLCIPPSLREPVTRALQSLRNTAREAYNLDYRTAIVPVRDIHKAGHHVMVSRFRVSDHFVQAAFAGGGVSYAEELIKNHEHGLAYHVPDAPDAPLLDLTGLECRWHDIPSPHGETVALLVRLLVEDPYESVDKYAELLRSIESIYGGEASSHPIKLAAMKLATDSRRLNAEIRIRTAGRNRLYRRLYAVGLPVLTRIGKAVMRIGLKTPNSNWRTYKQIAKANTDYRKFDDMIRCVLAGSPENRQRLIDELEAWRAKGLLAYGMHVAPAAIMTCMIRDYNTKHFHFIDASYGGYTMAARQLKAQLHRHNRRQQIKFEPPVDREHLRQVLPQRQPTNDPMFPRPQRVVQAELAMA